MESNKPDKKIVNVIKELLITDKNIMQDLL